MSKNKKDESQRTIDEVVKQTTQNIKSGFVMMSKAHVKAWKAYLTVFFVAGFFSAIIWGAYNSWFVGSMGATSVSMYTLTTNEVHKAGEAFQTQILLDSASQNINAVQAIATYDSSQVSVSSIDTTSSSSDFPNEVLKKIDTAASKITVAAAKQTPGVNSSGAKIATVNLSALKDFNGAGITLKFLLPAAVDDSAAIADDGKGTNVLGLVYTKFTNPAPPPPPSDTTPPVRSGGSPTGSLNSGTTQTTLKVTTNESATCKYGTTAGTAYSSMTGSFSTTDKLNHSASVTGLADGKSYVYYVRCQDTAGNVDTDDYQITFSIASAQADKTPPTRSNGSPTGSLSSGTTQATLKVTTDEKATCKYSTTAGTAYSSMASSFTTTDSLNHTANATGLKDGKSYNFYVRCKDTAGNANTDDYKISFSVASPGSTALSISSVSSSVVNGNSAVITWQTSAPARSILLYGTSSSALRSRTGDGSLVTSHSITIRNLKARMTYYYRITAIGSDGKTVVSTVYQFKT